MADATYARCGGPHNCILREFHKGTCVFDMALGKRARLAPTSYTAPDLPRAKRRAAHLKAESPVAISAPQSSGSAVAISALQPSESSEHVVAYAPPPPPPPHPALGVQHAEPRLADSRQPAKMAKPLVQNDDDRLADSTQSAKMANPLVQHAEPRLADSKQPAKMAKPLVQHAGPRLVDSTQPAKIAKPRAYTAATTPATGVATTPARSHKKLKVPRVPVISPEEARRQAEAEGLLLIAANNSSGYRGVHIKLTAVRRRWTHPYYVYSHINGKQVTLGSFACKEQAALCYARHLGRDKCLRVQHEVDTARAQPLSLAEVHAKAREEGLELQRYPENRNRGLTATAV